MRLNCTIVVLTLCLLCTRTSRAGGPPKQGEPIPAPQQKIVPEWVVPETIVPPPLPRPGTREVWQYYGVDSFGRFRPRVILAPQGAYYLQTLEPFPWTPNRPTRFMPYTLD